MKINKIFFIFALPLFSQVSQSSNLENPYLKFSVDDIKVAAQNLESNPNEAIKNIKKNLDQFYLLNPAKRRIQQKEYLPVENFSEIQVNREWNSNLRRVIMSKLLKEPINSYHIKDAPNIFLAHFLIGRAYAKLNQLNFSLYHFAQALRYRSLHMSEGLFEDDLRNKILSNQESREAEKAKVVKENYKKIVKKLDQLNRNKIILEDESRSFSNTKSYSEIQTKLNAFDQEIEEANRILKKQEIDLKSINKYYLDKEINYNKESSAFLIEIANVIKIIESPKSNLGKKMSKRFSHKTLFKQTPVSDYPKNPIYIHLLEIATKLDSKNFELKLNLAKEYNLSSQVWKAISTYEDLVTEPDRINKNNLLNIFNQLGALYLLKSKYVQSIYFYEEALKIRNTFNSKFALAKLHLIYSHNYKRARELLSQLRLDTSNKKSSLPIENANLLKSRFEIARMMGVIGDKLLDNRLLENSYNKALSFDKDLLQLMNLQKKNVNNQFIKLQEAKSYLIKDKDQANLNRFLQLENSYKKELKNLQLMQGVFNSIPRKQVYFSLARYFERQKNISKAIETLIEAEKGGVSSVEARRYIDRLEKFK